MDCSCPEASGKCHGAKARPSPEKIREKSS